MHPVGVEPTMCTNYEPDAIDHSAMDAQYIYFVKQEQNQEQKKKESVL